MSLTPGTRLGIYEITAQIGVGGMGEVYQAADTNLKRQVAIKVLPAAVAGDADRLARFQREAEVLAALNHPNIAAIYGLEKTSDFTALVMELVEGDDLSQRIAKGAIPIDEALPVAKQIAEALEAAHEQNIIHRDLKPANIKVRADGTVKVLDFGLAKAMEPAAGSSPNMSLSPTLTTPAMTQAGTILGTAAYMAPEQAKGRPVDRRADIWAFGTVLFEMLTGTRAFPGEDLAETLGSVVKLDPSWDALPIDVPAAVRTLLQSCLVKDPRRRVADISTALFVLDKAASLAVTATATSSALAPSAARWGRAAWMVAAVATLAAVAMAMPTLRHLRETPPPVRPIVRLNATPPGGAVGDLTASPDVVISADGRTLAYTVGSTNGSNGALFVRPLDSLAARQVSASSAGPAMSPDSQWLCFFEGSALKKVAMAGGPALTVANFPGTSRSAAWGPDDSIILSSSDPTTGLFRVNANGGTPEVLTTPDRSKGELDHRLPEFLPDGRSVLFTITGVNGGAGDAQIALLDLETRQYRVLIRGGTNPRYAASGHIVYAAEGRLFAVRFDRRRLEVRGTPLPVVDGVAVKLNAASFSLSREGTLGYVSGPPQSNTEKTLVWVDRDGGEEALSAPPRDYRGGSLSPDGSKVALQILGQEGGDIWIWDIALKNLTRLTLDPETNSGGVWSADSRKVAFTIDRTPSSTIAWQAADGSGAPTPLTSGDGDYPDAFTSDGRNLIFDRSLQGVRQLFIMSLDGSGKEVPLFQSPRFDTLNAVVSPDGRWVAYQSNESGRNQVYVRPFPDVDAGGRWQVSTDVGGRPMWARDGRELFFRGEAGAIMAVSIAPGPAFRQGTPQMVVKGGYVSLLGVSPDGHRFLMRKGADSERDPKQLVVVLNWLDELTRLVPE